MKLSLEGQEREIQRALRRQEVSGMQLEEQRAKRRNDIYNVVVDNINIVTLQQNKEIYSLDNTLSELKTRLEVLEGQKVLIAEIKKLANSYIEYDEGIKNDIRDNIKRIVDRNAELQAGLHKKIKQVEDLEVVQKGVKDLAAIQPMLKFFGKEFKNAVNNQLIQKFEKKIMDLGATYRVEDLEVLRDKLKEQQQKQQQPQSNRVTQALSGGKKQPQKNQGDIYKDLNKEISPDNKEKFQQQYQQSKQDNNKGGNEKQ